MTTALRGKTPPGGRPSAEASRCEADTLGRLGKVPLPNVTVSNVRKTDDSVEFDVSRTGVPVMVKVSDFPNWRVEGANGPWHATPNFMVVVPTSRHVRLEYGTTTAEWVGRIGTLTGLAGLGGLVWWGMTTPDDRPGSRRRRVRFLSRSPR